MRIALVSPYAYPYPGGVTEHVSHLGAELRRLGHEVRVIAPSAGAGRAPDREHVYSAGGAFCLPANGSIARIGLAPSAAGRVQRILSREGFDVVHLHEPLLPCLPLAALRYSRAVNVGTFHACWRTGWAYRLARPVLGRFFARLDGRIAVSEAARQFVGRHFPGEYTIIPNGVDGQRFSPAVPPLPGLRDGRLNVLFVGRLEKRKGLDYLIRAVALLPRGRVRLVVVGDGGARRRCEALARESGLDAVFFAGRVSPRLLPRYYASADVCCVPSLGGESFGIVLLEAMASGKPLVASDIEGYRSVVSSNCALLVPPGDVPALADALSSLLADADRRAALGAAGLARSRDFTWPSIAGRVLEVYRRAGERRGEPRPLPLRPGRPDCRGGLQGADC